MTLEIEYANGDTETTTAKIHFFNDSKVAVIRMPTELFGLKTKWCKITQHYYLGAEKVERRLTDQGVVYSGIFVDAKNRNAKFFLYL